MSIDEKPSKLPAHEFEIYKLGYKQGASDERLMCAALCEDLESRAEGTECCKWPTPADCAYAIRARG